MTIQEHLHVFNVGDKVTAEETNDNFETLESWINNHDYVNTYIDGKITELSNTYSSQIEGINSQISSVNSQLTSLNSSALKVSQVDLSKGYILLANGYKMQWGTTTISGYNDKKVTFKKSFATEDYVVVYSWDATQIAGDKKMNSYLKKRDKSYFTIHCELEGTNSSNNNPANVYWFAAGK